MATLAQRNVNPGNIKDPTTGSFKQFGSAGEGYAALLNDLEAKKTGNTRTGLGPQSTLVEFAEAYAPASDGNNPGQYAANLANFMGVRPDTPIGQLDTGKWAEAVSWSEDHKFAQTQGISPTKQPAQQSTSPYQTQSTLPQQPQINVPEPEGVGAKLSQDLSKRALQGSEALTGMATGQINPVRGILRSVGALAGGFGDIVGAGLSAVTPDFIGAPLEKATQKVVGGALQTAPGQAAVQKYQSLDPEIQKDIGAIGNIASAIPTVKGIGVAAKAAKGAIPAATKAAAAVPGVVGRTAQNRLLNEALDVVSPKETAKVIKDALKQGRVQPAKMFGTPTIDPDARTLRAAQAATGIVRKSKDAIANVGALRKEIGKTAEKLEADIEKMDIVPILQKEDLDDLMKKALDEIGENPTMVGNAEKSAERILKKFTSFLPTGKDITAIDILRARKKLDRWIADLEGGSKVFDPAYESAKTIALRSIRQGANDLVQVKAPTVAVKEALARQSALYDALDNLAAKAVSDVRKGFSDRHPLLMGGAKEVGRAALIGSGVGGVLSLFGDDKR